VRPEVDAAGRREFGRILFKLQVLKQRFPLVFVGSVARTHGRSGEPFISPSELAEAIHQPEGAARRLLARNEIPGGRRKTPDLKGSPWLIPADAPARYLALHEGRTNGTR
jgi:hypothetical protein